MNEDLQFLQGLFSSESQPVNLYAFVVQIILTILLALIISAIYVRFGNALSNRVALAKTFVLVALTTMLIITIVKSSLALSLGLVGALSIVRFRTAIKEPEELAYFFMVISIGLGIGAGQILVTVIGTVFLCLVIVLLNRRKSTGITQNLILRFEKEEVLDLEAVIQLLSKHCEQLELRRLDEDGQYSEASFAASFKQYQSLLNARSALQKKIPSAVSQLFRNHLT
jgi:uncharacterized membrane protein YhiD involved in acid resistance